MSAVAEWELDEMAIALSARCDPALFVNYHELLGGVPMMPHEKHQMMHEFSLCCLVEGKKMLLHDAPEQGKSTHMRGEALWWRGLRTLPEEEQAAILQAMGRMFYGEQSREWWLEKRPPAGTFAFLSANTGLSKKNLIEITKMVERRWMRMVFPGLVPDIGRSTRREAGKSEWSSERLYFEGDVDPSFEVFAAMGKNEGERLAGMMPDDFFTADGATSEAERARQWEKFKKTWLNRLVRGSMTRVLNNNWHPKDGFHMMRNAHADAGFATLWFFYVDTKRIGWKTWNAPEGFTRVHGTEGTLGLWDVWPESRLRAKMLEDPESLDGWRRQWQGGDPPPEGAQFGSHKDWARYDVAAMRAREGAGGEGFLWVAALDKNGGKQKRNGDYAAAFLLRVWMATGEVDVVDCWVRRGATSTPREQIEVLFEWHARLCREGRQGLRSARVETPGPEAGWIEDAYSAERKRRMEERVRYWDCPVHFWNPSTRHPGQRVAPSKETRIHTLVGPMEVGSLRWPGDLEERMRKSGAKGQDWRNAVEQMENWTHLPDQKPDNDDAPDGLSMAWAVARELRGTTGLAKGGKVSDGRREMAVSW